MVARVNNRYFYHSIIAVLKASNVFLTILLTVNAVVSIAQPRIESVAGRSTAFKRNLGRGVNSVFEETKPIVTADGKTLYFARKNAIGNTGGLTDPQDIYRSALDPTKGWTLSVNAGQNFNTRHADNLCAVIGDDFVFYRQEWPTKGNFILTAKDNTYSTVIGPDVITESKYLEAYFNNDGTVVLFTAKTKKNILYQKSVDERDIYISFRKGDSWTQPENMGRVINTSGDEFSPYLSSDQRTLYFASNGRGGFGDVDIFVAHRLGNGWSTWTEPINLGSQVNTPYFDAYFSICEVTNTAYMVSYNNTIGKGDIVSLKLPPIITHDFGISAEQLTKDLHEGDTITLDDVLFARGSSQLVDTSAPALDEVLSMMKTHASMKIEVHGHTDNMGTSRALKQLSEKRARVVREYFIRNGIDKARIECRSFGGTKPAARNDIEEERKKNRRVELIVRKL
jgi:outer membrane protein OmpA-like peptidoglycan-associated protein